jgi:hypothetical protein
LLSDLDLWSCFVFGLPQTILRQFLSGLPDQLGNAACFAAAALVRILMMRRKHAAEASSQAGIFLRLVCGITLTAMCLTGTMRQLSPQTS